jgi:hypothetical protein
MKKIPRALPKAFECFPFFRRSLRGKVEIDAEILLSIFREFGKSMDQLLSLLCCCIRSILGSPSEQQPTAIRKLHFCN